jgi:23S rRNA (uracil1939-C5)-methyltransferase
MRRINNIENAEFLTGESLKLIIPRLSKLGVQAGIVVVVDPPRKGCDEKLLQSNCRNVPKPYGICIL